MNGKDLQGLAVIIIMAGVISSCQMSDKELGTDILPPGDNVEVYHDTIFEINAYPIKGEPLITSEIYYATNRVMLLGSLEDTIFGKSTASAITQFNSPASFIPAGNMEIDSLFLALYIRDFIGDKDQDLTLSVYEFTDRLYMDSLYYSDYDAEGKYNPVPLVQQIITPEDGQTYELLIKDQDFIDKFLAIQSDTNYFYNDSIFKDYFNGLYITAEPVSQEGTMARIELANTKTRLTMKYANDSTEVDSTAERDFRYAHFTINEFSSQKINMFEHDFSGTRLGQIINDENAITPYSYVEGMAGVNTRFSFANLQEWMDQNPVIINSATLVFDVVPEEQSGILYDNLPNRLMISTLLDDNSLEQIYDFNVLWSNDATQQATRFGGYKKAESLGLFSDTTYTYQFRMGLHFQAMLDGTKSDNDFVLQVSDGLINPRNAVLWSNLPANEKRIRLEIVYLKL
jgi:Domain of unknown function (DUF4270)